jgi:signal transduction histidine kinase
MSVEDTLNVLVIDDNVDDRMLYRRVLKKAFGDRLNLAEEASGERGLDAIAKTEPRCVLLDYSLPGRNGIEVLKRIRSKHPHLPVILLTGQGNEAVAVQSMKEGAQDYITKATVNPETLSRVIRVAMEHSALQKRVEEQHERVRERTAELGSANAALKAEIAERKQLEAQLLQAQKMDALGTLAGGIAHDLNNTLVPILGLTKLTMKRLPPDSREYRNLATILQAGERARDLVRQILAFSRKEAPTRLRVDFASLVRDSLKMIRASIPATIDIAEVIEIVPSVFGDPSQLHQIVINFVVNASQAIGDRMGTITVSLAAAVPAEEEHAQAWICLSVGDTGCGMDEGTRQRVFEPFFTTKPVGEGTGLGLSVVHGIVVQHGGRVTVESQVGQGTRFDVYLPALAGKEQLQAIEAAEAAQ